MTGLGERQVSVRGVGSDSQINVVRRNQMEALGILRFIFGLAALAKVMLLESRLKKEGVLS